MGKKGPQLSEQEARERSIKKAEQKARKAAKRAIAREARAKAGPKEPEGWSKGIQKGEYGEDIFDGKVHAKWPSLFKKHIGYLESHIKALDRVMQAMKSEMVKMTEEQRKQFELNEDSKWRTICGLMDRARETLVAARFASMTIIPPSWQKDKSGLGVTGLKFERLVPALREKAEAEGIFWNDNKPERLWGIPKNKKATTSDTQSESGSEGGSSDEESDSDSEDSAPDSEDEREEEEAGSSELAESNPFFIIDTKPTPVNLNGSTPKSKKETKAKIHKDAEPASADPTPAKKGKKRSNEVEPEEPSSAKKSKGAPIDPASIDFAAVEAQLHAEVEAGLKAKEREQQDQAAHIESREPKEEKIKLSKKEKKRKRDSDGIQAIVESFKKKQRREERKKEKAAQATASGASAREEGKKSKKRKAEQGEDEGKSKKARAEE